MRLGRIVLLLVITFACSAGVCAAELVNPGFEEADKAGRPTGWYIHAGLDTNGYGRPDFKVTFGEVVPKQAVGGHNSAYCAGYPREGTWLGKINDHLDAGGNGSVDGRKLGKAALSQTVTLDPGVYVFGTYLRTADGGGYTAAFSLGHNYGSTANYANDDSTGIQWTAHDLALKTSFEGIGFLTERGEWYKYQTEPFEVKERGPVTVWIRFNFVNNNSMPTRWQVDNAFIVPYTAPEQVRKAVDVKPTAGAPLVYPLRGMLVADCADDSEQYLLKDNSSTIKGDIHRKMFQHSRCVKGDASFTYSFPIDPKQSVAYLAFEHMGPCKITVGGRVVKSDPDALEDKIYPKEYVFTDRSLWENGEMSVKFESADPARELGVIWIEAGTSTRYRERLNNIEWDTTSIPWRIGVWDATCNEFRGKERTCIIGKTDPATLNSEDIRIEWSQKVKPGHRYYLVLGYFRNGSDESVRGYVNIGDDDVVEMISKIDGHEAFNYDITEYLKDGKNVVSVQAQSIDYVALIETLPGVTDNRKLGIYFGGDELAENVTRVLHNSMFWVLNSHFDYNGFIDASVPYGKWWCQYWPIDIAFAVRSMLAWGYLDQCEAAAKLVAQVAWSGHASNGSGSRDNNGGNMLATDMCEIILRRGFEPGVTQALWPKVSSYCDQICEEAEKSPFGLIKGTNWENAGSLKTGPCYALTTNLTACWVLLKAADTAAEGNLAGNTDAWRAAAQSIRSQVLDKLVFKEDVTSPVGWTFPKGTWAYGLLDDGSYLHQPYAGYLWAGHSGTSYYGYIDPDKELRSLYSITEDVAEPLVGDNRKLVGQYSTSYDGELTMFCSASLADKTDYMSRMIPHIRGELDYDRDKGSTRAELSRWAYGVWVEDTNLVCVAEFLDWPKHVIGIDDILYQGAQLRVIPRLPTRWNECGVNDWHVQYLRDGKRASTSMSYNYKTTDNSAVMRISTEDLVKGVQVRVGPFAKDAKVKQVTLDGKAVKARSEIIGDKLWLWTNLDTDSSESVLKAVVE